MKPRLSTLRRRLGTLDTRRIKPPPKRADPFYTSAAWRALMRRLIAERGRRCEDPECRSPNRGEGGKVYGDHVRELQDGGAPLDEANVLLRCASCHTRKTAAVRRDRARQMFG